MVRRFKTIDCLHKRLVELDKWKELTNQESVREWLEQEIEYTYDLMGEMLDEELVNF